MDNTIKDDKKYTEQCEEMVRTQIERRGVNIPEVLAAIRAVPRHLFVPEPLKERAYGDFPLPLGEGQTISQPYIVAEMTRLLALSSTDRVLEIGTGSGYQTAVLAEIAAQVYSIERLQPLLDKTLPLLERLNYKNISVRCGDGTQGWPEEAPFDAIIVTAGAPYIPEPLISQLAEGGRMVIPVGDRYAQEMVKITKTEGGVRQLKIGGCRFVKLIGKHGWDR